MIIIGLNFLSSYRVDLVALNLVQPINTFTYMTSFDNVIFIARFEKKFDKRVVDDITPTFSSYAYSD